MREWWYRFFWSWRRWTPPDADPVEYSVEWWGMLVRVFLHLLVFSLVISGLIWWSVSLLR